MTDLNNDEYCGATVSGVCPESGENYTIKAGEAYTTPSGVVIDSAHGGDVAETPAAESAPKTKAKKGENANGS